MGKIGATSWLSVVKKALSPTKGSKRRGEQEEEHLKKRGKKRWIFHKPSPYERTIEHKESKNIASSCNATATQRKSTEQGKSGLKLPVSEEVVVPEQRRSMVATTGSTEAAFVTARTAVEVIRLATPFIVVANNYAAVTIQTAFRRYLARRALKALKGVVKLQAFVRGSNVRKRAKMTLQCMQSLLRVQNEVCDRRKRLSIDPNCTPLKHFYQTAETKSDARCSKSIVTEDAIHKHKYKEANLKRENSLACAFSRQIWRSEEKTSPLERTKTLETPNRHSLCSPMHVTSQNLLINSLTSPLRSRIRASFEASPSPRYMEKTESAAARERQLERERENGFSSAKKRLSFAG